jgi:hypothetical protein
MIRRREANVTVPLHGLLPQHFILTRLYPPRTTRKKYVTVFEMKYVMKGRVSLTDKYRRTDVHSQFSGERTTVSISI